MIKSFRNDAAEAAWARRFVKGRPQRHHQGGTPQADADPQCAHTRRSQGTPGNHLEALAGDRKGAYSIRINDQWRVCFRWQNGDAHDVEIVDYH